MLELPDDHLSAEQLEFRDTLRRFFEANAPMSVTRSTIDSNPGICTDLWKRVCDELALPGLAIAERDGGQGFGMCELAIALGEAARTLAPIPLFGVAALLAPAIESVTTGADRRGWLSPLAAGHIATLAWAEPSGDWSVDGITTHVDAEGRITGEKCFVLDADIAERYFVVSRKRGSVGEDGLSLLAVEAGVSGVEVQRIETLDLTRRMFRVRFDGAEGHWVGGRESAGPRIGRALDCARSLLCAEMVGGMERVLETAVDYARTRFQFGRPIGSFQAIKHKAADMLIDFEAARTSTHAAVDAVSGPSDADDHERALLVRVAKAWVGPAYVRMTTENLQIHGGVGFTWEYDAHLFFRRAQSSAIFLGEASDVHEEIAFALASTIEQGVA